MMDRCADCPGVHTCIQMEWGRKSDYLFIGEAPGKEENRRNQVFTGKTGQELTEHYLPLAGLRRGEVSITNAIKCLPVSAQGRIDLSRPKDLSLLNCCASTHLWHEITDRPYKLIIALGSFACYALDPEINLELQHGIPIETSFGTVFPMYHPASGIHEPKRMLHIRNDWIRLGRFIKGTLTLPVDEYPNPIYQELDSPTSVNDYTSPIACDTEITKDREPWCLTFSTEAGTGNLIRAKDKRRLAQFQKFIDRTHGPILFHNWLFDCMVIEEMGLHLPHHRIVDTMMYAYHLGNIPQGLKALAYRLLGMKMEDFDDLVTPHSLPLCLDYLERAKEVEWERPEDQLVSNGAGEWRLYRPQSMSTKIKRFWTDYRRNPAIDIFDRWENWSSYHTALESKLGRWPGKCISHVPFKSALYYACRDTDALIRLWYKLNRMRRMMRKGTQDQWI